MEWLKFFSEIIEVGTFLAAMASWILTLKGLKEARKREELQNSSITIYLVCEEKEIQLPYAPLRRQLSRAEILGVLGMVSGGVRFDIPGLTTLFTSGEFDKMMKGETKALYITCPLKEFELFSQKLNAES